MAIKILKEGNLKNQPVFKRKCPKCGCVFECTLDDALDSNWRGGYLAVLCPTEDCNYPVALETCGGNSEINHPILDDTGE